jgi:hypothetical protein
VTAVFGRHNPLAELERLSTDLLVSLREAAKDVRVAAADAKSAARTLRDTAQRMEVEGGEDDHELQRGD